MYIYIYVDNIKLERNEYDERDMEKKEGRREEE
jgi:hypothetical protein